MKKIQSGEGAFDLGAQNSGRGNALAESLYIMWVLGAIYYNMGRSWRLEEADMLLIRQSTIAGIIMSSPSSNVYIPIFLYYPLLQKLNNRELIVSKGDAQFAESKPLYHKVEYRRRDLVQKDNKNWHSSVS